jgi:hypothetical protein
MTISDVRPGASLQHARAGADWVAASHSAVHRILRESGWSSDHRNAAQASERAIP